MKTWKRTLEVARHLVEEVRTQNENIPLYQAIDSAISDAIADEDFVAWLVENPTNDVIVISIQPDTYEALQTMLKAKFKRIPVRLLVEGAIAYSLDQKN